MRATIAYLSVLATAIALAPGLAHLASLPNKIGAGADTYFTMQRAYDGWAYFGWVVFAALFLNLAAALQLRSDRPALTASGLAFLLILATLAIFFKWTFPANRATENWTAIPADWEQLRNQWEYSHAANAVLTFCAVAFSLFSAMRVRGVSN